jgi:hypothetical protein
MERTHAYQRMQFQGHPMDAAQAKLRGAAVGLRHHFEGIQCGVLRPLAAQQAMDALANAFEPPPRVLSSPLHHARGAENVIRH